MNKRKLVYISSVAVPTQIKLCYEIQEYFDAEFWFYEQLGNRPDWWKIDLGEKCKIISKVFFKKQAKYLTFNHIKMLNKFNPDVVMLGGFIIPANFIAFFWAKCKNKKTIVFTERSRDKYGNLRKNSLIWKITRLLYLKLDLIMVSAEDIINQYKYEFKFNNKIVSSQYPCDLDSFMQHNLRKNIDFYTILFPNRLTEIYNPLMAIETFYDLFLKYPKLKMLMNSQGELKSKCVSLIRKLNLNNCITFIDDIKNWDDLHKYYASSHIMFLPAKFSNGNFTILESMASGMGVIISEHVMGINHFFTNNENGFISKNIKECYINSFEYYFDNSKLIIEHGKKNKESINRFTIKETAKLYCLQISSIL